MNAPELILMRAAILKSLSRIWPRSDFLERLYRAAAGIALGVSQLRQQRKVLQKQ